MKPRLLGVIAAFSLWTAQAAVRAEDVVPVVSAKSPITALSPAQVADIFLGKTNRFPDGSPAVPLDLAEDSPERDRFYAQYTGKSPAQVKSHWAKIIFTGRGQPPRQVASARDMRKLVAENPNAIGYIDPGLVDASVRVLTPR
jgi:ABC-type phosphate transport system substrate-binding protein